MSVVSDVEIRLRADIARLRQDLQDARREVTGALNNMSAAAEAFKGLLSGIAAGLSVGAFVSFIKNSIDAADALNDMSVRTKVAIEDLAGLAYAAKLGDTSLDGVASSISKLGQNIGKEGAKFRALGVTATEPLEAFKQLADIFKNIQDPQQRAAFGAEALGKSWQEAAVLLDGGAEGITSLIERGKELSGITEEVAADAGKFNDKLDELGTMAQGVGTRIAAGLLPMLNLLVQDMSATGGEIDSTVEKFNPLTEILRVVVVLGGNVAFVLKGVATEIGTFATQIGEYYSAVGKFAQLDFSGGWATLKATFGKGGIGDQAADAAADARAAFDKWEESWMNVGTAADRESKRAEAAGNAMADALIANFTGVGQAASGVGAKVAAFLNSSEIAGARDKAAAQAEAAIEKEKKAYAGLIASIKEKMAADQAEVLGAGPLTDAQKMRIKLDEELKAGKITLTEEHEAEARALINVAEVLEKSAKGLAAYNALQKDLVEQSRKAIQAAQDEADKNEELVKTFGMTATAIAKMELARLQDQLAQRASTGLTIDEIEALEKLIDAKKRSAAATGSLDALEKQKKASDAAADAQVAFWKSIDDTAHATFVSIANGSKDTAQRLKDTFKNVFFDWLYQQTIKKWIINIGTETTAGSTASGIASLFGGSGGSSGGSGAGGILGTASNWLSIGKTIYSGFTGGLVSSLGSSIGSLGTTLGSEAVAAFGAGIQGGALGAGTASAASGYAGTTAAGFGASAASAIPIIGWIIAGMQAADGFRKQGFTANNGTITNPILQAAALPTNFAEKTMKAIGFNDAIANILSGAAINTKLFGRADPRIEAQGLRGTVSAAGFDADSYAKIIEKGGIFRSSKRYEKSADLDAATDKAWDETIANMITSVKGFGSAMGIETAAIDSYTKTFDLKLTGKAEEDNAAVAKLFGDVGDELSMRLVPGLAAFAKEGETMSATLQHLAVDYQTVDAILTATGQSIKLFGVAGIQAREDLIAAAGGLEQLSSGVQYFQQNFLSGAQQLAPVQKQVAEALAAMGKSAVTTNDQFRDAVLGIDLNTKAGADLYVQMLALAPAFKVVADAAEAAIAAAQASARAAEELAAAKAAEELQRIADAARALTGAVDSAMSALERSVRAQKDLNAKAFDDLMKSIAASIVTATGKVDELKQLANALSSGVTGSDMQGEMSRAAARAALSAAAQVAKSGGGLPGAADITTLLASLRSDSAENYGSMIEYQRASAAANRDIAALAAVTDTELSVAQKTLTALQNQKAAAQLAYDNEAARLDGILAQGQAMVDKLNGIYGGVLSIPDALAALAASIGAAGLNPLASAGGAAQSAYNTYLGRAATESEIAYWKEQAAKGVDVRGAIAGSDEARIQALYQKYLGRTGDAAGVDAWEAALAAGQTWQQIETGFANSAEAQGRNNSGNAMAALTEQMAGMQAAMNRTAMSTTKLADQFDQVSGGGNALYTESA